MIKGSKVFKVTITGKGVDPRTFDQYPVKTSEDDTKGYDVDYLIKNGSTSAYIEKAKANYRWMLMSMNLNKGLETLSSIKTTGDSPSELASKVEFLLTYTQPDGLYVEVDESEYSDDKEIIKSGDKVLFLGKKAIKRIIEDTLNQTYNVILTWFDTDVESSENDKIYTSSIAKNTVMGEQEVKAPSPSPSVTVGELFEYTQFSE